MAAELPPVQTLTQRVVASVLQLGFVLVDLGSPTLPYEYGREVVGMCMINSPP